MSAQPKTKKEPFRVRFAPTIQEALEAAWDISSDPSAHVAIAAELMGVSEDDVRAQVARQPRSRGSATIVAGRRSVLVERRVSRPVGR